MAQAKPVIASAAEDHHYFPPLAASSFCGFAAHAADDDGSIHGGTALAAFPSGALINLLVSLR